MGIRYTSDVFEAITNLYIIVGDRLNGFNKDDKWYSPVEYFGNNYGSLNSGTGGTNMWLYATKEGSGDVNTFLKSIGMEECDSRIEADVFVKGLKSDLSPWDPYRGVDINTGAGGKYRYIRTRFWKQTGRVL